MILFLLLLFPVLIHALEGRHAGSLPGNTGSADTTVIPGYNSQASNGARLQRPWVVGGLLGAGYGGTLLLLNEAWYKNLPRTSFHTFNDAGEWLQVDKVGHGWSAYGAARATTALWQWSGLDHRRAVWLGSLTGFSYMTIIEWLDAYSVRWGWSWADMGANFSGAALFALQEVAWKEQRVQWKFSAHRRTYAPGLQERADDLFGASLPERLLKDYNNQTYWLSFNLHAFFPRSALPPWLNVSVGYGAEGLYGGFANRAYNSQGQLVFDRTDLPRRRQWYLSPDIDLTKIPTRRKWLKTALSLANAVKIPAPALELSGGKLRGRWVWF